MQSLERAIRRHVAQGSGIPNERVLRAWDAGPRPVVQQEPWASALLTGREASGWPAREQSGMPWMLSYWRATFSLQWWGAGAVDAAARFQRWVPSETAVMQESTAFSNGMIRHVRVHDGGTGYTTPPAVTFSGGGGNGAIAVAAIHAGRVVSVRMTDRGTGYADAPSVTIAPPDSGTPATATAYGYGFSVLFDGPFRRLSEIVSDASEERAQLDITVLYDDLWTDADGAVMTRSDGEIIYGDLTGTVDA